MSQMTSGKFQAVMVNVRSMCGGRDFQQIEKKETDHAKL